VGIWDRVKSAWESRATVPGLTSDQGYLIAAGAEAFAAALRHYYDLGGFAPSLAGVTWQLGGSLGATGVIDQEGALYLLLLPGARDSALDSLLAASGYRRVFPVPPRPYEVWAWWI